MNDYIVKRDLYKDGVYQYLKIELKVPLELKVSTDLDKIIQPFDALFIQEPKITDTGLLNRVGVVLSAIMKTVEFDLLDIIQNLPIDEQEQIRQQKEQEQKSHKIIDKTQASCDYIEALVAKIMAFDLYERLLNAMSDLFKNKVFVENDGTLANEPLGFDTLFYHPDKAFLQHFIIASYIGFFLPHFPSPTIIHGTRQYVNFTTSQNQ